MEPPVILLVAHADEDVYMLRFALLGRNLQCDLRRLEDGQEAIDYLNGTSQYSDRETFPFPVATILDFKLPYRSGLDVLAWTRRNVSLKDHPVVMFGGPGHEIEQQRAAQLHATRCIPKSTDWTALVDFLETVLPRPSAAQAA